jgi:membrane protein DedA with SNARE-associated domain
MEKQSTYKIEIARRAWYEWLAWAVWAIALVFTGQNAMASNAEFEPAASMIFWATFAVLLVGGVIVWFVRRQRQTT